MLRNLASVMGHALILVLSTTASVWAADFGTAEEAKAMLERAVAAVKEDKAKALDMFNNGEGGFKDRDLYVWCANASDGIVSAQPYMNKGKQLRDIKGKHGAPFGETIMQNATEGTMAAFGKPPAPVLLSRDLLRRHYRAEGCALIAVFQTAWAIDGLDAS